MAVKFRALSVITKWNVETDTFKNVTYISLIYEYSWKKHAQNISNDESLKMFPAKIQNMRQGKVFLYFTFGSITNIPF